MYRFRPLRRRERFPNDASGDAPRQPVLQYEPIGSQPRGQDEESANWKQVLVDFVTHFVVESVVIVVGVVLLIWFLGRAH